MASGSGSSGPDSSKENVPTSFQFQSKDSESDPDLPGPTQAHPRSSIAVAYGRQKLLKNQIPTKNLTESNLTLSGGAKQKVDIKTEDARLDRPPAPEPPVTSYASGAGARASTGSPIYDTSSSVATRIPAPEFSVSSGRKMFRPLTRRVLEQDLKMKDEEDWNQDIQNVADAQGAACNSVPKAAVGTSYTNRTAFGPSAAESSNHNTPGSGSGNRGHRLFGPLTRTLPAVEEIDEGESGDEMPKFSRIGQLVLPINDFTELVSQYNFVNVVPGGGIKKCVRRIGKGRSQPPPNALFWINYKMIVEGNDEPIFSTTEPFKFQSGQDTIMPWLDHFVNKMQIGEISYFLVGPKYGFGDKGMYLVVDPGASVLFEVELKHFMEAPAHSIREIQDMSQSELSELGLEEVQRFVIVMKNRAKDDIKNEDWDKAYSKYQKAIGILDLYLASDADTQLRVDQLVFELWNNCAFCWLKLEEFDEAKRACEACLAIPTPVPGNRAKVYYRLASAEFGLGSFEKALSYVTKAKEMAPTAKDVLALFYSIRKKVDAEEQVSKELYTKMSGLFKK